MTWKDDDGNPADLSLQEIGNELDRLAWQHMRNHYKAAEQCAKAMHEDGAGLIVREERETIHGGTIYVFDSGRRMRVRDEWTQTAEGYEVKTIAEEIRGGTFTIKI